MIKNTLLTVVFILLINNAFAQQTAAQEGPTIGKLYWVGGNQLCRANPDGSQFEVLVKDLEAPDGLVVSLLEQQVYWTNMARGPNGSLQRSNLAGAGLEGDGKYLVAPGSFETGKEIELDTDTGKLYWADRDGKKVMRANRDGSEVEVFVEQFVDADGTTVALENPVGIALDLEQRQIYFTDRFMARVMRASLDQSPQSIRKDVQTLIRGNREVSRPIDIDLDLDAGLMYWTDRGEHTISVARLDGSDAKIIVDQNKTEIEDPIGISLDLAAQQMVWTDMTTHKIHRANLDGSQIETILAGESLLNGLPYGPLGIVTLALEPNRGSRLGGQEVAVIGSNFVVGNTQVMLGKELAKNVEVVDQTLLRFTTPPGKIATVDLTITTPLGSVSRDRAYTYLSEKNYSEDLTTRN